MIAKGGRPVARLVPLPEELLELFAGKGERRPRPGRRPATSV